MDEWTNQRPRKPTSANEIPGWVSEKAGLRDGKRVLDGRKAKESRSEDGERLPVFEKSGSGVYPKPTVHSQSWNTGQEWSEVINDSLMFRTVSMRSCEDRSD